MAVLEQISLKTKVTDNIGFELIFADWPKEEIRE